jgi:hypothetical protein
LPLLPNLSGPPAIDARYLWQAPQSSEIAKFYYLAKAAALAFHGIQLSRRPGSEVGAILKDLAVSLQNEPLHCYSAAPPPVQSDGCFSLAIGSSR